MTRREVMSIFIDDGGNEETSVDDDDEISTGNETSSYYIPNIAITIEITIIGMHGEYCRTDRDILLYFRSIVWLIELWIVIVYCKINTRYNKMIKCYYYTIEYGNDDSTSR